MAQYYLATDNNSPTPIGIGKDIKALQDALNELGYLWDGEWEVSKGCYSRTYKIEYRIHIHRSHIMIQPIERLD